MPVQRTLRYEPRRWIRPHSIASDRLLWLLLGSFATLVAFSIGYFHYSEGLSWLDACYFVVVTVASVGYGDISTIHSSPQAKVVNIFLILGAMVCVWMIFSLLIDRIIRQRIQLSLGRRRYTESGHVIVCGLGRLGHCVAEELLRRGHKVVAVELDENSSRSEHLRQRGVPVYTGNARAFSVLEDVNVARAAALISVIDDDYANLEIALNARSIGPDLRLVLRIYDEDMARQVSTDLDIHLTLSMSALADQTFASAMDS